MKKKQGKVYVVCAMDTEGPIVNKNKPDILQNWSQVKSLIKKITSAKFRNKFKDSSNKGLVFSWFILTLTGFKSNPFKRPMKYHHVFDFYKNNFGNIFKKNKDGVYWHYHQPALSGVGNEWSKDWTVSQEYFNILSRMVSERSYFPSCFRAGGRIEDNDLSNWIENWIPFDFSNSSGKVNWLNKESDGKRLIDLVDWSKAPQEWAGYNPSSTDYQKKGDQKRYLFRCPDLNSNVHKIDGKEIEKAFIQAKNGKDACFAFFEHDRRLITADNIYDVLKKIKKISLRFPKIKWYYKNANEAANLSLKLQKYPKVSFKIRLNPEGRLLISANNQLFGRIPFVCYKIDNRFFEQPLNILGLNKWITAPIKLNNIKKMKISVAACNPSGLANVQHFKYKSKKFKIYNN